MSDDGQYNALKEREEIAAAAAQNRSYLSGLQQGWMYGCMEDSEGYERTRQPYLRELREAKKEAA